MRAIKGVLLIMLCLTLFAGCGKGSQETVTDRKIPVGDISEFYYTFENLNYNAFYQRYRFYNEDDRHMFYHETRERPDEYGPTTEADITDSGTFELSAEEWADFLTFLGDGAVRARTDSAESGSSGPWMFIYWKNDKGKFQVFDFSSYDTRIRFEEFCSALAETERYQSGRSHMKEIRIHRVSYSPGYGDMLGGYHASTLEKGEDGSWRFISSDRETHDRPTLITTYAVSAEAVAQLEAFITDKNIFSLEKRPKSDLFLTDYSPWHWSIDYEATSPEETKREYCGLGEYKQYSGQDYELLNELEERFFALRGEKIAETTEEN